MDGLTPATPEASATSGVSIPLDLVSPLSPYREQGGLSIRVERLPFNARLSKGRNNGDNTWSLTLDDLNDLLYLPPEGLDTPHTLTVRAICIEDDSASTLMRFDVPIGSGEIPDAAAIQPGTADQAAPPMPNAEAPSLSPPLAEISGDQGRQNDESTASATAYAFDAAESLDGHVAAPVPAPNTVTTAPLPGSNAYPPPTQTLGTEAVIAQELEQRVAAARASWEAEQPGRVAAAVQEAVRKAQLDARAQLDQTTEVRLAMEMERRLAEARASWETELEGRIAVAVEDAARKAGSDAMVQIDQTNGVRLAQEVEQRLAEARVSWEAELQGRIAVAVESAVQQAKSDALAQHGQANEIHLAQEVARRLAEARVSWEGELQGRVAAAVQEAVLRSETEARTRLEQAQQESRIASTRELAEMSARYTQAEAALAELRGQALSGQGAEASVRQLSDELSATQALVRARESELAEARHTIERARAEITTRDKGAAASVERNRVAWNSERETLLAQAEENAKERVKHALERWQNETAAVLAKAQQEWIDAEETRLAVAEMQWRENIGIAKSRAPIAKMTKHRRRVRISGRAKRFAVIAVCLVAAVIFYPRVQPVVIDRMWPKIVAFKGDIEPSLRETSAEIRAWIADVVKRSKATTTGKKPREPKRKQ